MKRSEFLVESARAASEFVIRCKTLRDLGVTTALVSDDVLRSIRGEDIDDVIRTARQVNSAADVQKLVTALSARVPIPR